MEILQAMTRCKKGGYVARRGYPNLKYYKNTDGIFPEIYRVAFIDFVLTDWEACEPSATIFGIWCNNE